MTVKRCLSNYETNNQKNINASSKTSSLKSDIDCSNNSYYAFKINETENNIFKYRRDNWAKFLSPITKKTFKLENNSFFKGNHFLDLIHKSQRNKAKSLGRSSNQYCTSGGVERVNRKPMFSEKNSSIENNLTECNQNFTTKKSRTFTEEEKKKSKCCCIKGVEEEMEYSPNYMTRNQEKEMENLNLFVSRLHGIIANSIESTKQLYESKSKDGKSNLDVLELLSTHMKDQETELSQLKEYRVTPMTFFDFCLMNSDLNGEGGGDLSISQQNNIEENKTQFNFFLKSSTKIDEGGVIKYKGTGKLFVRNDTGSKTNVETDKLVTSLSVMN